MRFYNFLLVIGSLFFLSFIGFAEEQKTDKQDRFEYNIYWRLGLNTDESLRGKAPDAQGEHKIFYDIPTSRHVRSPNYFWSRFDKIFSNGTEAVLKIDSEAELVHHTNNWSASDDKMLRVRDLYLQLPLDDKNYIWAGSRTWEFEDIRLFDYLNHFNVNGYGVGVKYNLANIIASFEDETLDNKNLYIDNSKTPVTLSDDDLKKYKSEAERQNLVVLTRLEFSLGSSMAIKPMVKLTSFGTIPEKTLGDNLKQKEIEGNKIKYSLGGVFSHWGEGYWENTHFWYESRPVDNIGDKDGRDTFIGLGDSASITREYFGVLTGLWLVQENYKDKKNVFKIEDGALVQDDDKTTKQTFKVSIGAQPIYYLTSSVHLALDLNQTYKTKKVSANDFNSTLITPILRYTTGGKNTLGNPQIYTSVTYGQYDWKAKKSAKGKPTDELITTQTGFEIWF